MNGSASEPQPHPAAGGLATPGFLSGAPDVEIHEGRYLIRFARSADDVHAAQRLRFEVFNLELGEGLDESHVLGRDEDRFDGTCHHLLVFDTTTDTVVGTYRMQTDDMARAGHGFYSADEYDLSSIPADIAVASAEVGRACVAREHRKQKVLFGLWKGLAAYLIHQRKRYLFGCCSLTSQDPREGRTVMEHLRAKGKLRDDFVVRPRAGFECADPDPTPLDIRGVQLPTLFGTYLRFSALVCSEPAIDRTFKTIDYLVIMDTDGLPARTRATFFAS